MGHSGKIRVEGGDDRFALPPLVSNRLFCRSGDCQSGYQNHETTLIKGSESINNDIRTGVVKENKPEVAGWLTLSRAIEPMAFKLD